MTKGRPQRESWGQILAAMTIALGAAGCASGPTTTLWSIVGRGDNPAVVCAQPTADEWKNMFKDPAVFKAEQEDAARQLIARGADVNAKDDRGDTLLHRAACSHWTNIVTILLDGGARPNEKNKEGRTPLFETVDAGIAEVLISRDAQSDAQDHRHATPLHFAAMKDNVEVAACLMAHGANIDATDIEGRTPLHWTGPRVARFLVTRHANLEARDKEGRTPLYMATWHKKQDVVEALIVLGADVNAASNYRDTPLDKALVMKYEEIVQVLKKSGAVAQEKHGTPSPGK